MNAVRLCGGLTVLMAAAFAREAAAQDSGAVPSGGPGAIVREAEPPEAEKKPVVVAPQLEQFVQAPYPEQAQKEGLQADVILKLSIDREGVVTAAEVTTPAGHGFDEAARDAALKFRFKPATRDGQPIPAAILYKYSFTLTPVMPAEPPPPPTTGNLTGQLRIADTDAPLVGAPVVIRFPDGTTQSLTTDAQGRFRVDGVPGGTYGVEVRLEGFDPVNSPEDVVAGEETDVTLRVAPVSEGIEIVVRGERPAREVTRRTVERREMERIPGTGGDALRSLQNLPGVARPPGLAGFLIVRGSAPTGTAYFVDGADVPLIYHFGGLSSVAPTELLDRIDFYPGNFSARYGRVAGGIVDVGLRSPDTRCYKNGKVDSTRRGCYHAMAEIDTIDLNALVQGPLPVFEDFTFAIGGRRSWFDTWLVPALREAGSSVTSAPVYYDYQALVERKTDSSRFGLRAYGSDDRFEVVINDPAAEDPAFGGNVRFATSFWRVQALYEADLTRKLSLTSMLSVGRDQVQFSLGTFFFTIDAYPINLRSEFGWKVFDGAKMNVGLDFQVAPFEVAVRFPEPPRPGEPDPGPFATRPPLETFSKSTGFRPAWYAELELTPLDRLRLVPGVRADFARDAGHADIAPRVNARFDLVKGRSDDAPNRLRTSLKGGAGYYYEPPQYQETDPVFGTPNLESNQSIHYALGVEQELSRQIELGVEGFYKDLTNQVSRAPESAGGFGYANEGTGSVMGLETLLKYKPDEHFFGWLSYTLSRSVRREGPNEPEYLFQYDQTHNLILLGSYRLGRGWEFGARFRVVSGPLDTPRLSYPSLPALYAADAGAYAPLTGKPFSDRLPLFHQLDLRIDKRWQAKDFKFSVFLDVQNVYNNPGVEGRVYNYNSSKSQYQTGVPILPSLGARLDI